MRVETMCTRGKNEFYRRPSIADSAGQPEAVHRPGHLDVGEYDANVLSHLQKGDRFISIAGFNRVETEFLEHRRSLNAN